MAVCAFALAIPLGVAAFIGHINATPLVTATAPVKPPQPNGYELYVRASNAIKPANPPVDAVLEIKTITDPKVRAQRYNMQRKEAWLAQNKAGFALFERAQKADSLAPPIYQFGRNSPGNALRQMARYKIIESNAHWQRGDSNAALHSGLDIVQLGYDIQRGGGHMDFLVGNALNHMSRVTTSDTIEHLSARQARVAARRLEKLLAARWTLEKAFIEDRERSQQEWLATFKKPDWRTEALFWRKVYGGPLTWKERWRAQTISKRQIMADFDLLYQRVISNARLTYGIKGKPPVALDNPFVSGSQRALDGIPLTQASVLTTARVLMLRLALRAYQIEHGTPPRDLQSLVPAYIQAVPADPFGKGEPLRYKTDGVIYMLWSIGPDEKDNGGTPISWKNKAPTRYADEREKLPSIGDYSPGDYVAGKNH